MQTKKIREGKAEVYIPEDPVYKQPVFYNSAAEMTRDISVCALQVFKKHFDKKINICDALSASGISGLRYAKEVSGIKSVVLNDKNPAAVKLIKKNIRINRIKNCKAMNKDASLLMRENVFNVIDLDPFGSPCTFMDSAARSIYHRGFLAVTATDQSALCGAFPDSCLRKYGIKSLRTGFYPELGVRILISFIILSLSRYEKAFIPLLSFSTKHYYRVFGKIEHSGKISGLLKSFGFLNYCRCGNFEIGANKKISANKEAGDGGYIKERCFCGNPKKICAGKSISRLYEHCGPIYLGRIQDRNFCKEVLEEIKKRKFSLLKQEEKLLKRIIGEANLQPFYFDIHKIAKYHKLKIPKLENLIKILKKKYEASRTNFCETGVKTDAGLKELKKIIKKIYYSSSSS